MPDREALAEEAAREFSRAAADSMRERGLFSVALAGGSTPRGLYQRLARSPYREGIEWDRVRFFWGDERCVPPRHERSNYRMARETLLDALGVPSGHVFRMRGEDEPRKAAAAYEALLNEFAGDGAWPRLDLVLLGLGPDGHTASLFPGTKALRERSKAVAANYVPKIHEWRLTLTYPTFNAARRILFLVTGEEKRGPAGRILRRERGYRALPASGIKPRQGELLWVLDQEAAGDL